MCVSGGRESGKQGAVIIEVLLVSWKAKRITERCAKTVLICLC